MTNLFHLFFVDTLAYADQNKVDFWKAAFLHFLGDFIAVALDVVFVVNFSVGNEDGAAPPGAQVHLFAQVVDVIFQGRSQIGRLALEIGSRELIALYVGAFQLAHQLDILAAGAAGPVSHAQESVSVLGGQILQYPLNLRFHVIGQIYFIAPKEPVNQIVVLLLVGIIAAHTG